MEEKIIFDKEKRKLKSNIDFEKYQNLFHDINTYLSYALSHPKNLKGIKGYLFEVFDDNDVPFGFRHRMHFTKRNQELSMFRYISGCTGIAQYNPSIKMNGQNMIGILKSHIEDCIERKVSFHSEEFDIACHLLMILEEFLPVLSERVERFQSVIEEIRDFVFDDSVCENAESDLEVKGDLSLSRKAIAKYYYVINDYTEALRLYKYIDKAEFLLEIGDCQLHLNRLDEALQSYQQGIESGLKKGYVRIGNYYMQLEQPDLAISYYQQAIDTGELDGYLHIGDYYAKIGKYKEAVAWYIKGLESGNSMAKYRLLELRTDLYSGSLENSEAADIIETINHIELF